MQSRVRLLVQLQKNTSCRPKISALRKSHVSKKKNIIKKIMNKYKIAKNIINVSQVPVHCTCIVICRPNLESNYMQIFTRKLQHSKKCNSEDVS